MTRFIFRVTNSYNQIRTGLLTDSHSYLLTERTGFNFWPEYR